jgi:cytochrome c553
MNLVKMSFLFLFIAGVLVLNAADSHAPKKETKSNERGKILYMTCQPCHGDEGQGNSITKAPAIAGLESWYVNVQLKKFKDGIRGAHPEDITGLQMRPMSRTLVNDKDIALVSDYIHSLPFKSAKATIKGDVAKGKMTYAACIACHGPEAKGNKVMNAPSLDKLPDWYIVAQLEKFKKGIRGTHHKDITGMQMRPMSQMLNAESRANIAAFISSLNRGGEKTTSSEH